MNTIIMENLFVSTLVIKIFSMFLSHNYQYTVIKWNFECIVFLGFDKDVLICYELMSNQQGSLKYSLMMFLRVTALLIC